MRVPTSPLDLHPSTRWRPEARPHKSVQLRPRRRTERHDAHARARLDSSQPAGAPRHGVTVARQRHGVDARLWRKPPQLPVHCGLQAPLDHPRHRDVKRCHVYAFESSRTSRASLATVGEKRFVGAPAWQLQASTKACPQSGHSRLGGASYRPMQKV